MDRFESVRICELERMIDVEKNPVLRQKLLVVWHKKQGKTARQIEEVLRIPQTTVGRWVQRFRQEGVDGLRRKPGSGGHNRYLTVEQELELVGKLTTQPMSRREVLAHIEATYGKRYHPNAIQRMLKRIGLSRITLRPRHSRANPRSGWAFKGHIKKNSSLGGKTTTMCSPKTKPSSRSTRRR